MYFVGKSLAALAVAASLASASSKPALSTARLYLFPAAAQDAVSSGGEPVSINAADANRILSYHLNVPGERLGPIVSQSKGQNGDDAWTWSTALQEGSDSTRDLLEDTKSRLIIYVDGVKDAEALLPSTSQLRATHHLPSSSPSSESWSALISSYGHKLSQVVSSSEGGFFGGKIMEGAIHAADSVRDWFAGDVIPSAEQAWKKTLDIVDLSPSEAMSAFQSELSSFVSRIESLASGKDSASALADFQAVRFQSLPALKEAYGEDSEQYKTAIRTIGAAVQSAVETFKTHVIGNSRNPRLAVIVSDSSTLSSNDDANSKRSVEDLLAPFSTAPRQFNPQQSLYAGSESSSTSSSSASPSKSATPKESDYQGKCFTSKSDLTNATAECSGHGDAVEKDLGGRKCFRCQCKPDRSRDGHVTYFSGEACQKIDISSPFVLLAVTSIVLVLLVAGSIGYMTSMGEQKLPGTLASVSVPNFKI